MIGDDYLSCFKKSGDNKMNASQIKSKFILLINQAGESNNFRCYYWDKGMRRTNNNININNTIQQGQLFSFKIGELFMMDYSAVSQAAKRFEQKSEVNNEIKENMQKAITALKEI